MRKTGIKWGILNYNKDWSKYDISILVQFSEILKVRGSWVHYFHGCPQYYTKVKFMWVVYNSMVVQGSNNFVEINCLFVALSESDSWSLAKFQI